MKARTRAMTNEIEPGAGDCQPRSNANMGRMLRAMAAGLAVFVAVHLVLLVAGPASMLGDFAAPALAGFAASWFAPRRKVLVGTSMALPPTVFVGVGQAVCELTTAMSCDGVGASGALFLTVFTLTWDLVFCGGGAVAAAVLRSRLEARASSPARH